MTLAPHATAFAEWLVTGSLVIGAIVHGRAAHAAEGPGPVDTLANDAAAGKPSVAPLASGKIAMADAMYVLRRVMSDAMFQRRVLEFIAARDAAGLSMFLQAYALNSTVSVTTVEDVCFAAEFTASGHTVSICISRNPHYPRSEGRFNVAVY